MQESMKRVALLSLIGVAAMAILLPSRAVAYTANKVWFEFRDNGRYRVYVNYTVPSLREFREAYVDFTVRANAEKFYWDLIKGADFHPSDAANVRFVEPPLAPSPW